jgi:hypothetical protein
VSGGSYDYACFKAEEMADELLNQKDKPERVAFGKHLKIVSKAMKAIEWVDSGDCSSPHDTDAIEEVIGEKEIVKAKIHTAILKEVEAKLPEAVDRLMQQLGIKTPEEE